MRSPYSVVKSRYITEKTTILEQLQNAENNPCVARCTSPKYVFIVDPKATKQEIASAVEAIYHEKKIKVTAVNTIRVKPKQRARGRGKGKAGASSGFKKAIVTLEPGDILDNV